MTVSEYFHKKSLKKEKKKTAIAHYRNKKNKMKSAKSRDKYTVSKFLALFFFFFSEKYGDFFTHYICKK